MTALLSAMGFRLRRSKSFWCLMAFEGIVGLVIPILNYRNNLKFQQEIPLDSNSSPLSPLWWFCPLCCQPLPGHGAQRRHHPQQDHRGKPPP